MDRWYIAIHISITNYFLLGCLFFHCRRCSPFVLSPFDFIRFFVEDKTVRTAVHYESMTRYDVRLGKREIMEKTEDRTNDDVF